jgi:UDP-2-acetamido-2-deoxy-ribo-hexuluronate aminotransferase
LSFEPATGWIISVTPKVPFFDLITEWSPVRDQAIAAIQRVFEHGKFVGGPEVSELEKRLAASADVAHAITCNSGTTALLMALMAVGVGPGDEVIVPAFTFIAPAECVKILGAYPVLVDVLAPSGLVDPASVEAAISSRTKAIIGVSLYGLPADFFKVNAIGKRHGIAVIEDAAQSFGASIDGVQSGGLASIGCTSFYPTKVLGGAGDGGALLMNETDTAERLRRIRDHGQGAKYEHTELGLNGRMSSICAAALLPKFEQFDHILKRRRQIGAMYDQQLEVMRRSGKLDYTIVAPGTLSARAQYTIVVQNRDFLASELLRLGVETSIHYPKALCDQKALGSCRIPNELKTATYLARSVLCLPIHASLSDSQIEHTVEALKSLI